MLIRVSGAGKTSCALEFAYQQIERFNKKII